MELRRDDFPVALQAYDVRGDHEDFVAEQVVNTQTEADRFMSLYAGRLIKTREVRPVETRHYAPVVNRRKSGGVATGWLVFLILLIALIAVGFATGWIQNMMGQVK